MTLQDQSKARIILPNRVSESPASANSKPHAPSSDKCLVQRSPSAYCRDRYSGAPIMTLVTRHSLGLSENSLVPVGGSTWASPNRAL
jgi:hypothetical protein